MYDYEQAVEKLGAEGRALTDQIHEQRETENLRHRRRVIIRQLVNMNVKQEQIGKLVGISRGRVWQELTGNGEEENE